MYLPFVNVGYILFTACMTLVGMLASDPEGALSFVSTLPLPFASSIMLLAPVLVQLQLEYVLQPLELMEISNALLSKPLRLASHVSSQPAGLSGGILHRLRPNAPLRILPAYLDWDSNTQPVPAGYPRDLWYPAEPSSSSTPFVKTEPQSGFKNTFATTGDEPMSLTGRTLIQSQSTRFPVLMIPALLFFGSLFVVQMVQLVASRLLRWNIDAYYDPDLERDKPCKMNELQPDDTSYSRTAVADITNTGISISSTGESAALEAVLLVAHAKCSPTNQDLVTLVDETSAMATGDASSHVQNLLNGDISLIVPSALPHANTVFSPELGLDVDKHQGLGGTHNITYDPVSDGPSPSHTRLVDGTFADHSISAVIPAGGTPPTKSLSPTLYSSKPIESIQDDPMVIYETSLEFTSDAQYHLSANPTPKDSSFPNSLDSNEVLVPVRSVDALAQGQHFRTVTTSNIDSSTVKHITCNAFSIERGDPSIGPAINISTSKPFTNDHTFGEQAQLFNMDDLISTTSGVSQGLKTKPYLPVVENPVCTATRSDPVGVVLVQFQDPSSGQAICIPLGSDSIDRGAITIGSVDAQGATAVASSSTRRKRSKPTKNQRMARNAARVYDIVLPFGDVDDLTDLFGRVKVKAHDIRRACAEANELCRQRRSRLQGHRIPYTTL